MPGASKRRQRAARHATGGTGGGSASADGSGDGPSTPAPSQVQRDEGQAQQGRPSGYDGGNSPQSNVPAGPAGRGPVPIPSGGPLRDPARDPEPRQLITDVNRRLTLPASAFNLDHQYDLPTALPPRPTQTTTAGKEVAIRINSYNILKYPDKTVYQYEILIGSGVEKRALIRKVWNSQTIKNATGPSWIFDGNRLAWALDNMENQQTITVDLDAEEGVTSREGRENKHRVVIRKTAPVHLVALKAYLAGKAPFDTGVLQAINFLDHLLRQEPSSRLTSIRQSFFSRGKERYSLGGGIEAFKGVYQTIRACQGGRLGVNVDVANGTFWTADRLDWTMLRICKADTPADMIRGFQDVPVWRDGQKVGTEESPMWKELRRFRKIGFHAKYRGCQHLDQVWILEKFVKTNAKEYKFMMRDKETKQETEISIYDYFLRKYNIALQRSNFPLVKTTKKGVYFPAELCYIIENQRYPYKLNDVQTASMIKFAVTRPQKRIENIEHGLGMLAWEKDVFQKNYGMQIDKTMLTTKARVLNPPVVEFNGSKATPGFSGRWDLKGPKKFLLPNTAPLESWAVVVIKPKHGYASTVVNLDQVQNFLDKFVKVYQGHGGRVTMKRPPIHFGEPDVATAIATAWTKAANKNGKRCQILMIILADKDSFAYLRIKKSCDCRFGVASQCVQAKQVISANDQYMSNVCMKFNAKLGGTTARVAGKNPTLGHFLKPSIVIGADVSHASPGTDAPSMAAITVSMDKIGVRYAAAGETNGHRVEMITTMNIRATLLPLVKYWIKSVNGGVPPEHVYYFRDGVSEGQYQHVLHQEVRDMKAAFEMAFPTWKPKFIVVVASKRHHIRFFPKPNDRAAADRNGNPLPGTLVERDVTHPTERDVYLCSHSAIQGTARPVHYHVLLDEVGVTENQLWTMIYEQCYSYIRSTTPVSLHPAVYYAHLASNRARHHENVPASSGPQSGPGAKKTFEKSATGGSMPVEPLPLLPLRGADDPAFPQSMWFI